MYVDKFDRMRLVEFVKKEINKRLDHNPKLCLLEFLLEVLNKINFCGVYDYTEIKLLIVKLLLGVSFLLASLHISFICYTINFIFR